MEQSFTNDIIDTTALPRFEEVQLTPVHKSYWRVVVLNIVVIYLILGIGAGLLLYFTEDTTRTIVISVIAGFIVLVALTFLISRISFKNKGFVFRAHDVIYRSGAIAITTTIIPYNRVQHAALNEGWYSRRLGLAEVAIFTAGGSGSDIKIPGIEKEHAENIKQLLVGKILKQDTDE